MRDTLVFIVALAACSMGKDPPPARAPIPVATVAGQVTYRLNGPGRKHAAEESFTHIAPIDCTVHAGTTSAHTAADGTYSLTVPAGHVEVSFEDCAKNCCDAPSPTVAVEVTTGVKALDWSCECDAK